MALPPGITPISTSFSNRIAAPLDGRQKFTTIAERNLCEYLYIGIIVFVTSEAKHYKLDALPSSSDGNWSEFTSGGISGSGIEVSLYANGQTYAEGDQVYYEHTTGDIFPITKGYYLRAKGAFTSTNFNIFDWEIITPNSWILDRVQIVKNNYEVFPGDTISIPSERYTLYNNRKSISKVAELLNEYLLPEFIDNAFTRKSVVIPEGKAVMKIDWNWRDDPYIYGMSHRISANMLLNIDRFPNEFEFYIKLNFLAGITTSTTFPEVPVGFELQFYPNSENISAVDPTGLFFTNDTYYRLILGTQDTNTFKYVKLSRTIGETLVKVKTFDAGYEPENILI